VLAVTKRSKLEMEVIFLGLKLIGAGLAAISMVGSGVGIGIIFCRLFNFVC